MGEETFFQGKYAEVGSTFKKSYLLVSIEAIYVSEILQQLYENRYRPSKGRRCIPDVVI